MKRKYNYFNGFCSALVVGLGQIVRGDNEKGIRLILAFYFVIPAVIYVSLIINGKLFLFASAMAIISGIILWFYNVRDALIR